MQQTETSIRRHNVRFYGLLMLIVVATHIACYVAKYWS